MRISNILQANKQQHEETDNNPIPTGQILDTEDQNKWEMDTEPYLDKIYNQLLGNVTDENGVWIRHPKLPRIMNELGAGEYIQELRSRINIHMQFSELGEQRIREIVHDTGKTYADKLFDNYKRWSVEPSKSNLTSISLQLVNNLEILLRIALNGGMKNHRERRGTRQYLPPQPQEAY